MICEIQIFFFHGIIVNKDLDAGYEKNSRLYLIKR